MVWAIILLAVVILFAWFHPDELKRRKYESSLASREAVTGEQLFQQFFKVNEIASDVPGAVRAIFAKHMSYPAEKMLPDDDFNFFWNEMDMADLVRDVESRFDISISDSDAERCRCTIRSVSLLVASKCAAKV